MQLAARPWIAAGLAFAGVGVITVTQAAPHLPDIHVPAVRLTADFDPISPWVDAFDTASANATTLADYFFEAPGAALQQLVVNQVGYLDDLFNDPTSIENVLSTISTNLQDVSQATTLINASADIMSAVIPHTLDANHHLMLELLGSGLIPVSDQIIQVLDAASSPLTGVLLGLAGPVLSPVVAFVDSIQDIVTDLSASTPDYSAALQELINIPADMTNAFFNGADLNLDALAPLLNEADILPAGDSFTSLDLELGGLLSSGSVQDGVGGSMLNSLGVVLSVLLGGQQGVIEIPAGEGVGPIGALTDLSQIVAETLGWDGTGNPLTEVTFPVLDGGGTAAAAAGSDLLSGLSSDMAALFAGDLLTGLDQIPTMLVSLF